MEQFNPDQLKEGALPPNVRLGAGARVLGSHTFRRFFSRRDPAVVVGPGTTLDGVQLALGEQAQLHIGSHSVLTNAVLLVEAEMRIGDHVIIGWNVTIADTDFHPVAPAERIADAVALSPLGAGRPRPPVVCRPVVIEDDVWIGPNAAILKGVRIGAGAFIEPGAVVTRDVPPRARVLGNPAQVVGEV